MKKIKSIKHLRAEKRRLQQRQAELEKAIQYDWRDLKESLKPRKAAEEFFSKMFNEKEDKNGSGFFADGVSWLAAKLARKMAERAEEKLGTWFNN
jgi:hypothetical protein